MSLFSALSPSSLIVVLPLPVTLTAALFRLLVSMFTSLSVTSTLSFPASMVTVWEEAVALSLFVMMVSVSFLVVTLFWVTSLPLSPAEIVMSPFSI